MKEGDSLEKELIICIAGAGSTYTPGIVNTLITKHKDFPVKEIRLYDIDKQSNEQSKVIIDFLISQANIEINIVSTEEAKIAFTGVDYVFSQIRAGGLKMREKDEKIPMKYGLVGQETCGLGGFSYGLRSMKQFLPMVGQIVEYAPEAWILNYTNPETVLAEAVRRKYPNANIINACDMVISIEKTLADIYEYDHSKWIVDYYGLNHFGWFSSIYDIQEKKDIMSDILEKALEKGVWLKEGDESWKKTYHNLGKMISLFPDYIPNNYLEYYLIPDIVMQDSNIKYTRANYVMDHRHKSTKELSLAIKDNDTKVIDSFKLDNEIHGGYIVDIAISHYRNLNKRFNLIVPNMGAIPNLRSDVVVEVPAYVNAKGVEPVSLRKEIPDFHKGLMEAQVASEKLLVDSFFEESYQKALQAFTLNQTVPTANVAKKILDEMIEVNGDLWPCLE